MVEGSGPWRPTVAVPLLAASLALGACTAEGARMPFMVAAVERGDAAGAGRGTAAAGRGTAAAAVPAPLRGAVEVAPVRVATDPPPWAAALDPATLREAVVNSLAARGGYVYGTPRYVLEATVLGVDQSLDDIVLGVDVVVGVTVEYRLVEAATGTTAYRQRIATSDTQAFRFLSAGERSRDALEAAVRRNIAAFLEDLAESKVTGELAGAEGPLPAEAAAGFAGAAPAGGRADAAGAGQAPDAPGGGVPSDAAAGGAASDDAGGEASGAVGGLGSGSGGTGG